MPYEMYRQEMEIPTVGIKFNDDELSKYTGMNICLVPDQLKRRLNIAKEYRLREKVGVITFKIQGKGDTEEEIEYDEIEQVFFNKDNGVKFTALYGWNDLRDVTIYQLSKSGDLLVEVPQFRNFMMYNVFAERILDLLSPSSVYVAHEIEEVAGKQVAKPTLLDEKDSRHVLQTVRLGAAGSALSGATASAVVESMRRGCSLRLVAVPGPARGNLYL